VEIGAFRTYPENYTPPNASASEYQSIPLHKIEDFGVHANQYYQLDVQIFKSSLDDELLGLLWNKYWVNTLSQSPLISVSKDVPRSAVLLISLKNRAYAVSQLSDLHQKLAKAQLVIGGTRATVPTLKDGTPQGSTGKVSVLFLMHAASQRRSRKKRRKKKKTNYRRA
jgi:COP9 signalosome complex subunit 5